MKISDELREWAELLKTSIYTKVAAEKISYFADRIRRLADSEEER